jgi:hypothetical protein
MATLTEDLRDPSARDDAGGAHHPHRGAAGWRVARLRHGSRWRHFGDFFDAQLLPAAQSSVGNVGAAKFFSIHNVFRKDT